MIKFTPESFFHITHRDNLPSILKRGIYSRGPLENENIAYAPVHDDGVLARRRAKQLPAGKPLTDYVNFYFQVRNPMLYRLICNFRLEDLAVLEINPAIRNTPGAYIADGNATSYETCFYPATRANLKHINEKDLRREYWNEADGSKRRIMAELLVPGKVSPENIMGIYVAKPNTEQHSLLNFKQISPVVEPTMFFQPAWRRKISDKISLAQGDLFFSNMQTLTVSVNTQGVMGKGLASRAKYQFPDVYVKYQDVCRSRQLKMGQPFLYKRDIRLEEAFADESQTLNPEKLNGPRWFLLFATKEHWRHPSPLPGIKQGLNYLAQNYERLGMESLALPALGCGLGGLEWKDVGPMMCSALRNLKKQVVIYLPADQLPDDQYLQPEYLLSRE